MSVPRHTWAFAMLAAAAACGPSAPSTFQGEETTGDALVEASSGTSHSGPTTAVDPASSGDDSSGEEPSTFIDDPDGGGKTFECDTFLQNCPTGEKCMYWANDGGGAWNATRCSPIDDDPDEVGEPCTVVGNGASGIDSCVLGAMCWNVDPETNEGECIEMCAGSESNPLCEDPGMLCAGRGPYLCLPTCCPIEQDCPEGQACYPVNDTFSCSPDASGPDLGTFGDPCEFINVCDPGLLCAAAEAVPGCEGVVGCCTAFCEVGSASCGLLDPNLECVPWFDEDHAAPGTEHIGACTLVP